MNIQRYVPKSTKGKVWAGIGLVVLASMIASPFIPDEAQTAAAASKSAATAKAKTEPAAERTAPPAAAPKYGVKGAKAEKFTLGGETELTVTFPIQYSLTGGMIRMGAAMDAFKVIDAVKSKKFDTLRIVGTYDRLQDRYGNEMGATEVMWAVLTHGQVRAINTDNLSVGELSDLEKVTCTFGMAPAMGYELQNTDTGDCY